MPKEENTKQGWLKPKVAFGFIIVLGIAFAALTITYKGFIELTETHQALSEPSRKLIQINSILTDIYEAESNIRTYTLTQDEGYLSLYFNLSFVINNKVDTLLLMTSNDPLQTEKIRQIQELLGYKRDIFYDLIDLKQTDRTSKFYEMALEEMVKLETDSLHESSVVTSVTTTTTSRRDTTMISEATEPSEDESVGMFGRMRRWFSKKEEPIDTVITKLIVEVETKIDTLRRDVLSPSDSLLNEVLKILSDIQEKQRMALYSISEKEIELLKSDKEIMDQIRIIVSLLEREELMNSYQMAEDVKNAVSRSTTLLLILGGAAFFMVIIFTSLIFRDISKANFYRKQLLNAKLYAEKLLKVKEEFLANISHEIRTPLSAIVGFSRQLQRSNLEPNQNMYVESLYSSSQHLLQIVNDLLDLSKIEGGHLRFESIPFSPYRVATDAVETFTLKAMEKDIDIQLVYLLNTQSVVLGDPFRLRQILYNLISNAVKFTNSGGISVVVDGKQDGQNISFTFEVADTGIGIPKEKLNTIFEQFSQVDTSTTRMYGGTGLGLTIVKRLAELQDGKVSVDSQVDLGSVFRVFLSYKVTSEPDLSPNQLPIEQLQLPEDLNILVVDDDPTSQLLVSEMLKTLGATAQIHGDPAQALEAIASENFSLILSDIQMPGLSGFDLVKEIANLELADKPVVIALTANSTFDDDKIYRDAGFHSVLIKPFDEFELYNVIAPVFNLHPIENTQTASAVNGYQQDYDISDIRRFAGGDRDSTVAILQSFVDNSKSNIDNLSKCAKNNDWKGISEVAHRMKSAFRQLKVYGLANTLERLEDAGESGLNGIDLETLVESINFEVERVQGLLLQDIENL